MCIYLLLKFKIETNMKRILLFLLSIATVFAIHSQTNLIHDPNFESANLSRVYIESDTDPASANVWAKVVQATWNDSHVIIELADDPIRMKTAQMQLIGTNSIPNTSPFRAFVVQRIGLVCAPTLYNYSFWAKAINGTPTVRIFVKLDEYTNQYFIFDTDKPTSPTGTYTAYCKNLTPGTNWTYFENDVDLSKKTSSRGSITYNQAILTTESERTNPAICFQNNTASSTVQVDEVKFIQSPSTIIPSTKDKKIQIYVDGYNIFVANIFGKVTVFDTTGREIQSILVNNNQTGKLTVERQGVYIVKSGECSRKVIIR